MLRSLRLLTLVAASALAMPALAETVTLTFVQTNDIDRMEEEDGRGGFARLMAVVKAERAKNDFTFLVHSGDTISPSLLSGIDKGRHVIDILNHMEVDVMVPGNHEFDFGPEVFRERMAEATFPIVSSNISKADGSTPENIIDSRITDLGPVKIGFYGLTTTDTPVISAPGGAYAFAPEVEVGLDRAAALRADGADFVVAVVHTPIDVDMGLVRAGAADLVLSGHDEHLLTYFNGKVAVTESYSQAGFAVVTDIALTKEEKDGETSVEWWPSFRIVDTATVTPDPEIAALVASYTDKLDAELKVEIGVAETPLDSRRATVRGEEAAIGNLITDAMRAAVGADIAITNGGGIRADREYPAGTKLTRGDVFAELPFGNKTVKLQVTGEQVLQALENGFSQVEVAAGRFPQVSGIEVTYNPGRLPGQRVVDVTVGGAPIDEAKTYTLATSDYVAGGGDGYAVFRGATLLIDPVDATLIASQVIDYIAAVGTVAPKPEGRISVVE